MPAEPTIESLQKDVANLTALLHRSSKAIAETGQRVMKIELAQERSAVNAIPSDPLGLNAGGSTQQQRKASAAGGDDEENAPVGSEDLVELVTELQGQLDLLDVRSTRRSANTTKTDDAEGIAALPGPDGVIPTDLLPQGGDDQEDGLADLPEFPRTLGEFKALPDTHIDFWLKYYELLPPDEAELRELLGNDPEADRAVKESLAVTHKDVVSQEERDERFDTLARYLGLKPRRTKGAW